MSGPTSIGCSCCGVTGGVSATTGDCCTNAACGTCGGLCLGVLDGPISTPAPLVPLAPPLLVRPWVPDPVQP